MRVDSNFCKYLAIAFSFSGDSEEVGEFMQKASHKTRSYYVNANGLKGGRNSGKKEQYIIEVHISKSKSCP